MAARHTRRERLYDAERIEFVECATRLHKMMMGCSRDLKPQGADYRALTNLNASICDAIRVVTGEPPSWMMGNPTPHPFRMGD